MDSDKNASLTGGKTQADMPARTETLQEMDQAQDSPRSTTQEGDAPLDEVDWKTQDQGSNEDEEENEEEDFRREEEDDWNNNFRGGEEFLNRGAEGGNTAETTGNTSTEVVRSEDIHIAEQTMKQMEATVLHRQALTIEYRKLANLVIAKYKDYSTNRFIVTNSFYCQK